jgi:CBS-domain-containing membrane protein
MVHLVDRAMHVPGVMKVQDLMTQNVVACSLTDSLAHAAQVMWEHDCGVVPIVDEKNRVVRC